MKKEGYIFIGSVSLLYIVVAVLYVLKQPIWTGYIPIMYGFVHLFGLFGIVSMFIATFLSLHQKQMYAIFGKPFLKIHHIFSLTGFVLITLHPVFFAIVSPKNMKVFIPDVSSWYNFWLLAGRPALYLIFIAVITAFLRKSMKKYWRYFHHLNYIALMFGTIHAILLGASLYDFQGSVEIPRLLMTILFIIMTTYATFVFIYKRIQKYKIRQKIARKKAEKEAKN